jgi:hypothetical protein
VAGEARDHEHCPGRDRERFAEDGIAMMMVATGLMVPIMETACGPTRASAPLIMKDGSTVDVTGKASPIESGRR